MLEKLGVSDAAQGINLDTDVSAQLLYVPNEQLEVAMNEV
jgi:hypothetical protein